MTAREEMERHARRVPEGIAWERRIFRLHPPVRAAEMIDAAVDVAWDSFPHREEHGRDQLEIEERGPLLVIRALRSRFDRGLPLAA